MKAGGASPLLWAAALVPLLYFGSQAVLIPLTPGYDPVRDIVSLLGAAGAPHAQAFNLAMLASGLGAIAGAVGLIRSSAGPIAVLAALALGGTGLGDMWAAAHPLPDPRHAANPFLPALVALPVALALFAWREEPLRRVRPWLALNLLLFVGLWWVRGLAPPAMAGLMQRLHAATLYAPPAVVALALLRSGRSQSSGSRKAMRP